MKIKTVLLITMFVAAGSLLSAQGLQVEPGICIKVETGTTLAISGGGDLFLESDATGDASLIDLGTVSYTGGGEANVERYLTNGKWHLVSAPVADIVAGQFENDYLQIHNEATNDWSDVTSLTYGLISAKGYALWTVDENPITELFAGTTNTGNQSYNFTQSGQGYNLVGNPYPSVLNWDAVNIPGQLNGAIWLFDPTVGDNGDYKYYISGGGESNTTTPYIPSGQGFFVRATGGAGTLAFDNNDRTHGGQLFYKATQSNQMLVMKATGNNITTQTAIRFIPEATSQLDRLFDVNKIISNSTDVPNVYTYCDGEKMAINTFPSIAGHEIVPLHFEAGMDGTYTFTATEMESLGEEVPVFLEDIYINFVQDMRANPNYSFAYASGAAREFKIYFKDVTGIENPDAPGKLSVNCYLANDVLHVNFMNSPANIGAATISVYSLTGQELLYLQTSQTDNDIPFPVSQAVYIVRITTKKGIFSTKVSQH